MDEQLLLEMKEYIEEIEVQIDGEWGGCRNLDRILEDKDMPDMYYKICDLLKK